MGYIRACVCARARVCVCAQSCQTLRFHDCSLLGFSVHGISQGRILEWVTLSYSRGSSQPRDWTRISYISCVGRQVLYHCHLGSTPTSWLDLNPSVSTRTLSILSAAEPSIPASSLPPCWALSWYMVANNNCEWKNSCPPRAYILANVHWTLLRIAIMLGTFSYIITTSPALFTYWVPCFNLVTAVS